MQEQLSTTLISKSHQPISLSAKLNQNQFSLSFFQRDQIFNPAKLFEQN